MLRPIFQILVVVLISAVAQQPYTCTNQNVPAADASFLMPPKWNSTGAPARFAPNQNCQWTVTVPVGKYAIVYLKSKPTSADFVRLVDAAQNYDGVSGAGGGSNYFFTSPGFSISLNSAPNTNGTLSFSIDWVNFPPWPANPQYVSVNRDAPGSLLSVLTTNTPVVITAAMQPSVVAVPSISGTGLVDFLRATIVFDGGHWNEPLIGSLYTSIIYNKQLVGKGRTVTIYSLGQTTPEGYALLQDYYNTNDIRQYQARLCPIGAYCGAVLDASAGPSAVTTIIADAGAAEVLNSVVFTQPSPSSYLNLYAGTKLVKYPQSLLTTYFPNTVSVSLPQKITGLMRTYYLSTGNASIVYTREATAIGNWGAPYIGRTGFLMSRNYPYMSNDQTTYDVFAGPKTDSGQLFKFTWQMKDLDVANRMSLVVSGTTTKKNYNSTFTSISATDSFVGYSMTTRYYNPVASYGGIMTFQISKSAALATPLIAALLSAVLSVLY